MVGSRVCADEPQQVAQPAIDRVAGGKAAKRAQAGLAADVERIKQEYLARMQRGKQKDAQKKERAKRKLQEIKEREKQEEEGTLIPPPSP